MGIFDARSEQDEEERRRAEPWAYAYDDGGESVPRMQELNDYAAEMAAALDASLSQDAPAFASLAKPAPVPAAPDVNAQMATLMTQMPDFTAPAPAAPPAAPQPRSLQSLSRFDGKPYGGPAPGTGGWDAIATPEANRPEKAPGYGTGLVKPLTAEDTAAHMASLGFKNAAPVLPSDRRPPAPQMPGSYAQALQMAPEARERALSSLARITPEQRAALQMLPGAPQGPKPVDPLTQARIASEQAKAGMYGSRGGLYDAQASKLSRLRRPGAGGGVPAGASDQFSSESVMSVISDTYERAKLQPPAGLLARAQTLDAVPRKQRSRASDALLREMDKDIKDRQPGAAGKLSATAEKRQQMLDTEERALLALKADLEKRDPNSNLPASTGKMGEIQRGTEEYLLGTSGLSDADQGLENALTRAGLASYSTFAGNAPNSETEQAVAYRTYRGSGRVSGALQEVNRKLGEIQAERQAGPAGATPAGGGRLKLANGGTAADTPENRAKLDKAQIGYEVM